MLLTCDEECTIIEPAEEQTRQLRPRRYLPGRQWTSHPRQHQVFPFRLERESPAAVAEERLVDPCSSEALLIEQSDVMD